MPKENGPEKLNKDAVLNIAKWALLHHFKVGDFEERTTAIGANIDSSLMKNGACFVTLTINGRLRGCIGSFEAVEPLYKNIARNSLNAALKDGRFKPVTEEELAKLEFEVSVLTKPVELKFNNAQDLLQKLRPGIDGVVIERGGKGAVYLPQVWEQILDKEEFLSELCIKGKLSPDDWQKPGLTVYTFQVEAFK